MATVVIKLYDLSTLVAYFPSVMLLMLVVSSFNGFHEAFDDIGGVVAETQELRVRCPRRGKRLHDLHVLGLGTMVLIVSDTQY